MIARGSKPVEDAKYKYFFNIGRKLSDPSTGTKTYWSLVNKILNKAKIPEIPPLLENDIFVLDFASNIYRRLKYLMIISFFNVQH